jgi:uncharacterized repeat protein (TIGR03943 family)
VSRETQHAVLLLLGGALVRITLDDTYLRYVRPGHRWLLLGAGLVAVALAVVAMVRDARPGEVGPDHGDHCDPGDHGGLGSAWLLVVPVLAVSLVAPPALGADTVVRAGPGNAVPLDATLPPLPPGGTVALPVAEVVQRAVWDTGGSLDGREVELTGFVVRRGAAVELARLTIVCCAADARPNRVRLDGLDGAAALTPDTWLRVRGTVVPGSATSVTDHVPAVRVHRADVVPAPDDPYEY